MPGINTKPIEEEKPNKGVPALWPAFVICWLLILFAPITISHFLFPAPPSTEEVWIAATNLPKNHQIKAGDLKKSERASRAILLSSEASSIDDSLDDYLGKYVTVPISKEMGITDEEISDFPSIVISDADFVVYTYPLIGNEAFLTEVLALTDTIQLCAVFSGADNKSGVRRQKELHTTCLDTPLDIVAIYDGGSSTRPGWLALKVPKAKSSLLGQFLVADKKYLLVVK